MITADQINRLILFSFLGICLFMLAETYLLPLDTSKGVVITKTERTLSRLRVAIFRIQTKKNLITVPAMAYNHIMENDTIEIGRSLITHTIQKIAVYKKSNDNSWRIGFISLGGLDYLVLLVITHILYLGVFYKKLKTAEKRRDLTIFISFLSVLFLLFCFLFE